MMLAQTYLSLPVWLQLCADLLMALLCMIVIVGGICRVSMMQAGKRNKWSWSIMYVLFCAAAADMLLHLALSKSPPPDGAALAITAIALNILLTRRRWQHGAPSITQY